MPNRHTLTRALAPAALLAMILILAPAPALAQPMGPPHPFMGSPILHQVMRALHSLRLADDERTQIHALMDQYHQTSEASREAMMAAHRALANQALSESFDEAAIRSAASSFSALQSSQIVGEAALVRDVRSVLTSDERDQLQKMLAKIAASDETPGPWDEPGSHGHGVGASHHLD